MVAERDALFEQRVRKAEELRALGLDPYANDFRVNTRVSEFFGHYAGFTKEGLESVEASHAVAGRVMAINVFGKAAFIRIQDGTVDDVPSDNDENSGRLQIYLRKENIGDQAFEVFKLLDLGDYVGIEGTPMRTKTNELTLLAKSFRILTKALRPLPEKWHGLSDVETRYRQRYLDLIVNREPRATFRKRAQIIQSIRDYFVKRDFLEVETPMMQAVAGGAAARPFVTRHNALDCELYLRIAPELYLKRLTVGGFDRVFEINRNFRNEGISTFHNPEFTTLEFYQAYATYHDLMDIGEELVTSVARSVLPSSAEQAPTVEWCGNTISFARPFARLTMLEAIAEHGNIALDELSHFENVQKRVAALGQATEGKSYGELVLVLFEHLAENKLIQPTYIYDFPVEVSPLSRRKSREPQWVERFELFVGGRELANAFSELNDPIDQRKRFEDQLQQKARGDEEAHDMDDDFVRALEHGLPPTGGFGMGIDRFVMLLTGSSSIRDVILFPQLRPERSNRGEAT